MSIKDASASFNQHNFDGRVFVSASHHSHYQQNLYASHHQYVPAVNYYQNIQVVPPQNLTIQGIPIQNVPPPVYTTHNNINNVSFQLDNSRGRAVSIQDNYASFTPPPPTNNTEKMITFNTQQNFNLY